MAALLQLALNTIGVEDLMYRVAGPGMGKLELQMLRRRQTASGAAKGDPRIG
jgi:hypothetical protein